MSSERARGGFGGRCGGGMGCLWGAVWECCGSGAWGAAGAGRGAAGYGLGVLWVHGLGGSLWARGWGVGMGAARLAVGAGLGCGGGGAGGAWVRRLGVGGCGVACIVWCRVSISRALLRRVAFGDHGVVAVTLDIEPRAAPGQRPSGAGQKRRPAPSAHATLCGVCTNRPRRSGSRRGVRVGWLHTGLVQAVAARGAGRVQPARRDELGQATTADVDLPFGVVDDLVVAPAQQHEVLQIR
jgi:hypothetical protein